MAPDFFEKVRAAAEELEGAQFARFVRTAEKIERQYKAIEASALEVRRLWRSWAGEEGH